jgi:hypothetical protein
MVPIFIIFFGLFTSGIQAFIFATIAATYIGGSMEGHHSLSFEIVYFSLMEGSLCLTRDNFHHEHKYTYK